MRHLIFSLILVFVLYTLLKICFICISRSSNKTVILCESPRGPLLLGSGRRKRAVQKDFVILTIDGATLYSKEVFQYKNDATVSDIVPGTTVHSGGTKVKVYGTNLNTVQHPKIGVFIKSTGKSVEEVSY